MTAEVNESQVTKPQRDGGVILNKGLSRGVSRELLMNGGVMTQKTPGCAKGNATNVTPRIRGNSQKWYIYIIYIYRNTMSRAYLSVVSGCVSMCVSRSYLKLNVLKQLGQ